jgi:hypothetical protein
MSNAALYHQKKQTFNKTVKSQFGQVSDARKELIRVLKAEESLKKAAEKAKKNPTKKAKKTADPWLVKRIADHDYPAILKKENEWQAAMKALLEQTLAFDAKTVASLEDMAARHTVRWYPTGTFY